MANKDYTYAQVKAGMGTYRYESPSVYAAGVKTMQERLNKIGYKISIDGLFGSGTKSAVESFQTEMRISADGIAGKDTITRLDAVQNSKYFITYGKPLEESEWGKDTIVSKGYTDKYIICRIIYAEERSNLKAQTAVALVMKNRANHSNHKLYRRENVSNKWIAVITKSGAYSTSDRGHSAATKPIRGGGTAANNYVDQYWKQAVDLAEKLTTGTAISNPVGYAISGKTITGTSRTFSTQLNQCAKSQFDDWYNNGKNPKLAMCFVNSTKCNVFCTI